jgi:hypothetical protein
MMRGARVRRWLQYLLGAHHHVQVERRWPPACAQAVGAPERLAACRGEGGPPDCAIGPREKPPGSQCGYEQVLAAPRISEWPRRP